MLDNWQAWQKLMFFLGFLNSEGSITDETYSQMTDCMMNFKRYAEGDFDEVIDAAQKTD
jgi:hypothetical protein